MVGEEPHLPYTRPPLSKELLAGAHSIDQVRLPVRHARCRMALGRVGREPGPRAPASRALRRRRGRLRPADRGDRLARAPVAGRPAPSWRGSTSCATSTTRSRCEPRSIAGRASRSSGAGFIGCEVAQTARKAGLDVTLIDIADTPMLPLGPELGQWCADLHRGHGVDLRLGTGVAATARRWSRRGGRTRRWRAHRRRRRGRRPRRGSRTPSGWPAAGFERIPDSSATRR